MDNKKNFPLNGLRVCIDIVKNGEMEGVFYTPLDMEKHLVYGLEDFMLKADRLFDEHGYPQAYVVGRSFKEGADTRNRYHGVPKAVRSNAEISSFRGKLATCDVIVESRRNATWQGLVRDIKGNILGTFDGELGIINIIRTYLGE